MWFICISEVIDISLDNLDFSLCFIQSSNKLNKQGDNIQPWGTPFPIWNQSVVPCPVHGPITSWEIVGETVESMEGFIFLGSKITSDGDCSHEIKRCLLLGRKVMINLDSILKSRDITLLTKVHLVKAMAFPVVMYGYESWTIKKPDHQRIQLGSPVLQAYSLWSEPTGKPHDRRGA